MLDQLQKLVFWNASKLIAKYSKKINKVSTMLHTHLKPLSPCSLQVSVITLRSRATLFGSASSVSKLKSRDISEVRNRESNKHLCANLRLSFALRRMILLPILLSPFPPILHILSLTKTNCEDDLLHHFTKAVFKPAATSHFLQVCNS